MKVTLLSFVSFVLASVKSETLTCKVVPFETKDGITGTCCVFFKNAAGNATLPKEEVAQQILSKNSEDKGEPNPPVQDKDKSEPSPPVQDKDKSNEEKLVFADDKQHNNKEGWMPKTIKGKDNATETKNFTIATKNAFDTPERCPNGKLKDHAGTCTEPF